MKVATIKNPFDKYWKGVLPSNLDIDNLLQKNTVNFTQGTKDAVKIKQNILYLKQSLPKLGLLKI